ncbi:heme peroxidase [Mycena metata]|uniref:Peroxidase n=1 Tax=Mycena metata TaxID=1033252 RepID=A0AAD7IHP8_9AGAR|nr:heme peroxidase [Mycena metata]
MVLISSCCHQLHASRISSEPSSGSVKLSRLSVFLSHLPPPSPSLMLRGRLALFVYAATSASAYVWPGTPQLNALEALRWQGNTNGMTTFASNANCTAFVGGTKTGRTNAADWIRTAYHDMATFNIADGTGGMDGSIRFAEEQARPEDPGNGFTNTLAILLNLSTRYASIADILSLGAIISIENCGGPEIAFRGGRVDAAVPNNPGVPEPSQDLASHISAFARQGFTQSEMIGLVACGHTFGGVQQAVFPDIVPVLNSSTNTQSVSHFDATFNYFDNNVATEYISGTTQNPLVVGSNATTNSDGRIFSSDGNVTMRSFANSPDVFSSTCATLIARMLDTVPAGIQLTEVITALPVKPDLLKFDLSADGTTIQFSGQLRLWDTPLLSTQPPVVMFWTDHVGATGSVTLTAAGVFTLGVRHTAGWYNIPALTFPASSGFKSMYFTVDGQVEDQDGVGFAVQDDLMWSQSSCVVSGASATGLFHVAVRNTLAPTRVFLEQAARDNVTRPIIVETDMALISPSSTGFSIWSVQVANNFNPFTIGAEVNGTKISRNDPRTYSGFAACPSS